PFARLLAAPGVPFVAAAEVLAGPSSELLARAAGGILFVADLVALGRTERKNLEFVLGRAERYKLRVVSFSALEPRALAAQHEFEADLLERLSELTFRLPALRQYAEDVPDLAALLLAQLVQARACPQRRLSVAALNALRYHA